MYENKYMFVSCKYTILGRLIMENLCMYKVGGVGGGSLRLPLSFSITLKLV